MTYCFEIIGNDIISRLTERPSQLRIDMKDQYDETGFAKYSSFQIGEEASSYQLRVSGFTGDRGKLTLGLSKRKVCQ